MISPTDMAALQIYGIYGAKHSPPGDKFPKSWGPHATGEQPSEIHTSEIKSNPNKKLSIHIISLNVDSNCVFIRF